MTPDEMNTELIRQIATLKERIGGLEFDLEIERTLRISMGHNMQKRAREFLAEVKEFEEEKGYFESLAEIKLHEAADIIGAMWSEMSMLISSRTPKPK